MISTGAIERLRKRLSPHAGLFTPGSGLYNPRRAVVDRVFNKKPAVVVACAAEADAAAAVRFARDQGVSLSIRAGGCSPAGFSSNDGGVLIDLSPLQSCAIDSTKGSCRFGAGVILETAYKTFTGSPLMFVGGECGPVGISGLTLGGGFSLLSRSCGLACDNLVRATVVTASGDVVTASAENEPDLYWALRGGGGGNYGVVTSLDLKLHRVEPVLYCATASWALDAAVDVLTTALGYFADEAPDELNAVWMLAPGATGKRELIMIAVYNGPLAEGEVAMSRLTSLGKTAQCTAGPQGYTALIEADFGHPSKNFHYYFKSGFVTGALPKQAVELLVERFRKTPEGEAALTNMICFELAGGAVNRVPPDSTAFVHRRHSALLSLLATWDGRTGVGDQRENQWANALYADLAPYYSGAVYQNYTDLELIGWARAYYGTNLERLMKIKRQYDPENVFRFAQSIPVG